MKVEDFEVWFDDSKTASPEEIEKQPPLPPEKQSELNKRMEQIFQKYLRRISNDIQ